MGSAEQGRSIQAGARLDLGPAGRRLDWPQGQDPDGNGARRRTDLGNTRMPQKPTSNRPMPSGSGTGVKSLSAKSAMSASPAVVGCRSSQNRYWFGFTFDKPCAPAVTLVNP